MALASAAVFLSSPARAASMGELVIIVNKDNPVDRLTDKDLANIFLDKKSVWGTGVTIQTCDLVEPGIDEEKTARALFSEKILRKDLYSLKNYWLKMIFSAKRRPPITKKRPGEVIDFVAQNPGGIGYIYSGAITDEVKVVEVIATK